MNTRFVSLLVIVSFVLPACANHVIDDEQGVAESTYFEEKAKPVNELLVFGPQPEETDLAALKANGIQKVISFRRPEEMKELSFEQETVLQQLGIEFANIPIGGDNFPYSPAAYQSLVDELTGLDPKNGAVLLHCTSGWRASVVGVAYLVKHEGMELNEALKYAVGWWPLSLSEVMDSEFLLQEVSE